MTTLLVVIGLICMLVAVLVFRKTTVKQESEWYLFLEKSVFYSVLDELFNKPHVKKYMVNTALLNLDNHQIEIDIDVINQRFVLKEETEEDIHLLNEVYILINELKQAVPNQQGLVHVNFSETKDLLESLDACLKHNVTIQDRSFINAVYVLRESLINLKTLHVK